MKKIVLTLILTLAAANVKAKIPEFIKLKTKYKLFDEIELVYNVENTKNKIRYYKCNKIGFVSDYKEFLSFELLKRIPVYRVTFPNCKREKKLIDMYIFENHLEYMIRTRKIKLKKTLTI